MTATLPDVAAKKKQAEQSAEQQAAAELVDAAAASRRPPAGCPPAPVNVRSPPSFRNSHDRARQLRRRASGHLLD
jgi:hypothetical protein